MVLNEVLTIRVTTETLKKMQYLQKKLVKENNGRPAPYGYILDLLLSKSGLVDEYDE